VDVDELRARYLAATSKIADSAHRRGDSRLALSLRAHELSVAINAGDFSTALVLFEDLSEQYQAADQPEPWLVNSLSWASGKFADHLRDRPNTSTSEFSTSTNGHEHIEAFR
jgi:hypothetical protein